MTQQQSAQPPPAAQATKHVTMVLRECGICQSSIYPSEQTIVCPKCSLVYHAECWQENLGCATYGCEQVNALQPKPEAPVEELPPPVERPIERLPWNFALLGAAALCLALSALSFGVPSLAVLACVVARGFKLRLWNRALLRDPRAVMREPVLIAAGVLAVAGIVLGAIVSTFWWIHGYTPASS